MANKPNLEMMSVDELWSLHEEICRILSTKIDTEMRELERRLYRLSGHVEKKPKARRSSDAIRACRSLKTSRSERHGCRDRRRQAVADCPSAPRYRHRIRTLASIERNSKAIRLFNCNEHRSKSRHRRAVPRATALCVLSAGTARREYGGPCRTRGATRAAPR